jgi:hypothetical protein
VTSIAALAAGIVAIFLNPISTRLSMLTTCLILFYAWWLYFKFVNQCGEAAFEWGGRKTGHNAMETEMGLMGIKTGRLKRDRMFRRPVTVGIRFR